MRLHVDYFECDGCHSKDFVRVLNFCLRFHGVNFSDELIYDRVTAEAYKCLQCGKRFTVEEVDDKLAEFKDKRRRKNTPTDGDEPGGGY